MKARTEGHRLLEQWVAADRETRERAWIGRQLQCKAATVSQWFTRNAVPDRVSQYGLWLLAGIPEDSWLTKAELKRREQLESRIGLRAA